MKTRVTVDCKVCGRGTQRRHHIEYCRNCEMLVWKVKNEYTELLADVRRDEQIKSAIDKKWQKVTCAT